MGKKFICAIGIMAMLSVPVQVYASAETEVEQEFPEVEETIEKIVINEKNIPTAYIASTTKGKLDSVAIITQDGQIQTVTNMVQEIKMEGLQASFEWETSSVVINIKEGKNKTSVIVTGEGISVKETDYKSTPVSNDELQEKTEKNTSSPSISLLIGVVILLGIGVAFLYFNKKSKSSEKPETDPNAPKAISEEEEIKQIKEYLLRCQTEYDDEMKTEPRKKIKKEMSEEPMFVTQEEIDNDDTIREMEDIFGSRDEIFESEEEPPKTPDIVESEESPVAAEETVNKVVAEDKTNESDNIKSEAKKNKKKKKTIESRFE